MYSTRQSAVIVLYNIDSVFNHYGERISSPNSLENFPNLYIIFMIQKDS